MYKLISKEEYDITRHVTLKNLDTGTKDHCFDDSDMVDVKYKDFYFMEIGRTYDCKIELFGNPVSDAAVEKTLCHVVRDNVLIGNRHRVEVEIGEDIYYIPRSKVEDLLKNGEFYYHVLRKDLVQVDNVIHGDFLD